ncbi:efflux pump, RND family, outer membrane protein [Citrifermentans bemidjiense Bem]|uniref:Efflux pump, RND family, outer membrane protein n=1 Tax=Citrifermentans bemidjiense (strain ATCC BAA-1014 / DSM 16622 / JCM 12645 / Bem) TaxID=404380 RepID=B5EDL6_CITBB|nr:TolC family protein [Citrifermentans bemidjiense]ACH39212.1 efflux pump, RND family, outer membrane protein [Citrifermentans bemidjiense Bem]
MKITAKTTAVAALCLLLGMAGSGFAQEPTVNLTLKDAIRLGFERNLDLKVELYNPAMAEADIRRTLGIYDPLLTLGANYNRTNSNNTLTFRPQAIDQATVNAGVSQLLPTGTVVGLTAESGWVDSSFNKYYSNGVSLTLNQPLLRNFGQEATELQINVSRLAKEESIERFKTRLSDTVAQIRSDYFKLYNLREVLLVKRNSLALAQRILADTQGRVKAGVLPAMEILNAEFQVATREKEVIDAERGVRDQMDVLRTSLQLPLGAEIVVADTPSREPYQIAEDAALTTALVNRSELALQRAVVRTNDLQQRVARNQTLPDLSLNASAGMGGFDRGFLRGLEKTATVEEPNWGIGLQFSFPLGNRAAENSYIRSKLAMEQSTAQLQSLEVGVTRDVKAAIRQVSANYKQIEVTNRGRAYAEDRLRAFEKRQAVGLATTKDVFDVENDLVTAKGNEIQALVDYNNSITLLWRVTGEILDRQGIRVTDKQADPLYDRLK